MAKEHNLTFITIRDLQDYIRIHEKHVKEEAAANLPTQYGDFKMYGYINDITGEHHLALVKGDIGDGEDVLCRVHSECLTGDAFGSLRCDCGLQLQTAMRQVEAEGRGIILYMRQEGRGIGDVYKRQPYIYTERNGIYIIDLQKSVGMVDDAYNAIKDIVADGGSILFVGTKKQAQDAIKAEAERCGMYYVNQRWLGGMLTNFKTIESRIARLKAIEKMSEDGTFEVLPKKEVIELKKEWEKLEKNLGGIKDMKRIPDAIFIVDPKKERICVQEAHILGIPLIGIADTNCDPEELDYVIPGNDDAIRAVKLIVSKMADAVIEAKQGADAETTEAAEADAE